MSSDSQTRLTEAEKSFKKACEQIVQLNRRLDEMAKRYDKASRENHRSFRYSLRLRMAVTEGVRNMYYEYAANKADEITVLRCEVLREVGSGNQGDLSEGAQVEEEEADGDVNARAAAIEDDEMLDNSRLLNEGGASDSAIQDEEEVDETEQNSVLEEPPRTNSEHVEFPVGRSHRTHDGNRLEEADMEDDESNQHPLTNSKTPLT